MNSLVDRLVSLMPSSEIYPPGVIHEIKPKIRGRSFFPGGCGLFGGFQQYLRPRPIVLVGQDFGTLEYWNELDGLHDEKLQGTWSSLQRMIAPTEISLNDCFYTNALLGVRVSPPIDGPSPGLDYAPYVAASTEFLLEQIKTMQPCIVVSLGIVPSILLAHKFGLAPRTSAPTSKSVPDWSQIDEAGLQFIDRVDIPNVASFSFATSVHPDRFWLNTRHRNWPNRQVTGNAAHDLIWSCVNDFSVQSK